MVADACMYSVCTRYVVMQNTTKLRVEYGMIQFNLCEREDTRSP